MGTVPKAERDRYWYSHRVAMDMARYLAAGTGVRQRVEPVTWPTAFPAARWFIAPTPAPPPCKCWPVDDPWTYYGIVEPGGALEPNPDCRAHFPEAQVAEPCS